MASYYIDENGVLRSTDDDEEYEVRNGKLKKKKKKNTSSKDSTGSAGGDIAPDLSGLDPAAQMGAAAGQAILKWFNKDSEDDRTWFQKGGKTTEDKVVGTTRDAGTDFTAGLVGIGEKIVDWGASIAPLLAKANYYQNGGGYNLEADKIFEESNERFADEVIAPFVEKDLYDEQKVAKRIVAGLESAAYLYNINQSGAFATPEQVQFANQMRGDALKYMDMDENGFSQMEADSVLGDRSDALIQSAGQLAGTSALAMAGVPWYLTTGAATWGAESENALKQGATLNEANFSGLVSAGAEILTEKISGGIKIPGLGKTADDAIINTLAANISNKVVRTLAKIGVDVVGEGAEEVLSGVMSAIGQKLSYASDKEFSELFSTEDALESFVGGMVLGGGGSVTSAVQSAVNGTDSVSGLTNDEYKVAQKQLEKFAEGKELTAKEKATEWAKITENMEKGYISAEDVEEALGGDSYNNFRTEAEKFFNSEDYKAYRKAKDAEDKARTEFDDLVKLKQGEMTGEQIYRRDDLKKMLDESKLGELKAKIEPESNRIMGLHNQMRSETFERVKGTKLEESYQELARKSQKFEVDVNQYEGKARETVQNIIDSGLGDNSNQFHEAVEFLAKISNDKGVTFTFTKTELLKGTEHYKEGYITNGFVDDKGNIVLNKDSKNAMHTIVGHEVTHVLKKGMDAESYKALESAVKDYCIAKEGLEKYNARLDAIKEAYKGKDNTSPEEEVTADLVGEYIFTDAEFVKKLSVDSRSTFEKIYDEIKYLFKVAVAGSEEKRKLEKVKKIFDDAWRENVKGKTETTEKSSDAEATIDPENDSDLDYESPVKYSVTVTDPDTIDFLENQEHITTYKAMVLVDGKLYPPMASKVKGEDGKYHMTNPRELGEWMQAEEDTTNIKFNDKGIGYYDLKKDDGGTVRAAYNPYEHSSNLVLNDQFEAAYKRDNLVTVECVIPASEMNNGYKAEYAKDSTGMMDWHSGVVAGKLSDNKRSVYLSRYLKATRILPDAEVAQKYKEIVGDLAVPFNVVSPGLLTELEKVGVNINYDGSPQYQYLQRKAAEREAKKNTKYSLAKDSNGKELTEAQAEFFKDSKVRDESGNLLKVYHGSKNGGFNVFRYSKDVQTGTDYGEAFYFTSDYQKASGYSYDVEKDERVAQYQKDREVLMQRFLQTHSEEDKNAFLNYRLDGKKLFDMMNDEEYLTEGGEVKEVYLNLTNPLIADAGGEYYYKVYPEYFEQARKNGNDGIIVKNVIDNPRGTQRPIDTYIAFRPEQIKNTDNTNPTADPDIRYSLTKDSDGNELTAEQAEFFKDSQMRDEGGRLKPMYHGSQNAGFHVFDNRFSDDGQSFFFVDSNEVAESYSGTDETYAARSFKTADDLNRFFAEIGADEYSVTEENGKFILMDDGDEISTSENANDLYEEFKDYSGLGQGSANYKTYLNITNPFKVDAHGKYWNELPGLGEKKYEYIKMLDTSGANPKIEYSMVGDPAPTVEEVDLYSKFDDNLANILSNLTPGEILEGAEANPTTTREYAKYAKENGYDGVIFENIRDIGQYMTGDVATVAVVFDSNQIKSVANTKPTADQDIRYSLTKDTKQEAYHNYLDAVNKSDTDTAQKLMDRFAKDAGYNYRGVHRSFSEFTVFDRKKIGSNAGTRLGDGFYVTLEFKDETTARYADESYGKNKMNLYVKMESPLVLGSPIDENIVNKMEEDFSKFGWFGDDNYSHYAVTSEKIKKIFQSNDGYEQMETIRLIANRNSMEISELLKQYGFDSVIDENDYVKQAVVFDESQLKSAEPITYDEYGDVIMPYERLDPNNMDIRYSLSPEGKGPGYGYVPSRDIGVRDPLAEFAPIREDVAESETTTEEHPINEPWREQFGSITDEDAPPKEITTVQERIQQKIANTQKELDNNRLLREESVKDYNEEIARLQAKYDSKKNKSSMTAQGILRSIERMKRIRDNIDADYSKRISDLEKRVEKYHSQEYSRAEHRRDKMGSYTEMWENLIGDTSTWKDMPLGLQYKTKTLRRILRNVVRGVDGKPDIRLADDIYDELETKYDHNEALLKKESQKLKAVFQELNLNSKEDVYAQMLGELRHNPETTLTEDVVKEYYKKHKNKIDTEKVDKAIDESRKLYDDLLVRVNEVLKEQGFKEIPYRKGYFPHFTNPKQTWWMKALNWKPIDTEIPTSIAGLTETFKPQRSWQSFNQQRRGDQTDYSLYKGLDTYVHGALDWIYHIEDLQKRRALENHLRFIHSDEGIQKRIEEIKKGDYDADEAQDMINAVLDEAKNPLSGLVRELMNRTNTLANKKAAADRAMEDDLNRKVYSTMTNLNNRVSANMVVGSLSSAMTNFIPMVQSWHEVSPGYTVLGLRDVVRSTIKDDGVVAKSDFLTNRLMNEENLYKTGWDKASDKAAIMMNVFDNITAQTVWRSKYLQNLGDGMSESAAIKNADQFAKNLIAGRSRGNMPTLFDAKNPVTKLFTAFQLEVANQYGYMFDDVVKDSTSKTRLVKGYAMAFMGAYVYNALYSTLVGRDAAFDPIAIIEDLMKGLFDDDEENEDVLMDFGEAILQNVPFVGGLLGGGRVPIQSALPYANDPTPFASMLTDVSEGNWKSFGKEFLKPLYYLAMPVGGGQIKKTIEGLGMFSDDHPIAGSYTDSGKLRFPVEETFGNVLQAGLFGQYASQNARDYFDNDFAPLAEKQIDEFADLGIDFRKYHEIREGLRGLSTNAEKVDYINSLDITTEQKNILVNNILDREEKVDMTTYGEYGSYEEFNYAQKNPDKYQFFKDNGISYDDYANADEDGKREYSNMYEWVTDYPGKYEMSKAISDDFLTYWQYKSEMGDLKADKDSNGNTISGSKKEKVIDYINNLDLDYGQKIILFRSMYDSQADRDAYNSDILEYLNSRDDISFEEKVTILTELGFKVSGNTVTWD